PLLELPRTEDTVRDEEPEREETVLAPIEKGEPFTLEEALVLAEQHNPQLRAATAEIEGAEAGITTARAYPNPEFNFCGGNQHIRLPGAVPGLMQLFSLSQPLELPGLRRARREAAEIGKERSEYVMADARLAVRAAVKQSFYQV